MPIDFSQIDVVTKNVVDPTIQKEFEDKQKLFSAFKADRAINTRGFKIPFTSKVDPHPWLTDARAMLRMLNDELKIPHARIDVTPSTIVCDECREAYIRRLNYKHHLLSTEGQK